jgi:enolase
MRLKQYILMPGLDEAAYPGNIGFEEMVEFYKVASKSEIAEMEKVIKKGDWNKFKELVTKVTGTKLK